LGTDHLGRDVLANLVHGAQTALRVSLPAMLLATLIGLILGCGAGFWGNTGLPISAAGGIMVTMGILLGYYYGIYLRQIAWLQAFQEGNLSVLRETAKSALIFTVFTVLSWMVVKAWHKIAGQSKLLNIPADLIVLKLIEIVGALPRILLVLCLASFAQSSIFTIVLLSAFTYWTSIARLVRGELLQVKQLSFIEAARVAGLSENRILLGHALPNALPPVIVAFAFGLGNLMSLEATLSYLGIGIPVDVPSWGRLLRGITSDFSAWWLLVFPTLFLCGTILSLQTLAQFCLRLLDPTRSK
jgi:peptide/nickel transport system permease protein